MDDNSQEKLNEVIKQMNQNTEDIAVYSIYIKAMFKVLSNDPELSDKFFHEFSEALEATISNDKGFNDLALARLIKNSKDFLTDKFDI